MRRKLFAFASLCLTVLTALCGCQTAVEIPKDDLVYVVLEQSLGVCAKQDAVAVKRGESAAFEFTVEGGYVFDECSYTGKYTLVETGENRYLLTILNVRYDTRFSLSTGRVSGKVFYYLNGGTFLDESNTADYYTQDAVLQNHLRLNTDIGTSFKRDGYTQTGWNTEPDGSGDHVGLGSRVTIHENQSIVLYAEWCEWSDPSLFAYETNYESRETGDITLTEYKGEAEIDLLSIPAYINGKKVTCVSDGFTEGVKVGTLVLPNTIDTLKIGAFGQSLIDEIYLYDNLMNVSNGSFSSSLGRGIPTVHINAAMAPRYVGVNDTAQFADDVDRLMLNADKKKMVFFAGCSMSYGLVSPDVEAAFGKEYFIVDTGVIGSTNAWFQFQCMLPYLGEGDVFVHAPEQMSSYQLLYKLRAEYRTFVCVEGNYDLLAQIDCSKIGAFFDCFSEYNKIRSVLPPSDYGRKNENYNEYGDIVMPRENSPEDANYGLETLFAMHFVTEDSLRNLNEIYGQMEAKGAKVFFSFAPINKNTLTQEDIDTQSWLQFENRMREGLGYPVISSAYDYLMEGKYFYDTDYHLSEEGASVRTQMLIRDLKKALS